jgi:hypothetical protein
LQERGMFLRIYRFSPEWIIRANQKSRCELSWTGLKLLNVRFAAFIRLVEDPAPPGKIKLMRLNGGKNE